MRIPELLAPVGSMEHLKVAINAGASSVYLSGKNYGARKFAENFTLDEIGEAVNIAHMHNVKVYITVNTLIKEDELESVVDYLSKLYAIGVDAVLVQDLGLIELINEYLPNLKIHASTQLTCENQLKLNYLESKGVKRVVLPREMRKDEIKTLNTNMELEIFAHGALCYSYSGQCLMSSFKGGRSGNRGTCAQPCRRKYKIDGIKKQDYYLSPCDLSLFDQLKEISELNISCIKIEGRMRSKEYLAVVVSNYRKALNKLKSGKELKSEEIKLVFNRGFSQGQFNNSSKRSMRAGHIGLKIGKVISSSKNQIAIRLDDSIQSIPEKGDGLLIIKNNNDYGLEISQNPIITTLNHFQKGKNKQIKDLSRKNKVLIVKKVWQNKKSTFNLNESNVYLTKRNSLSKKVKEIETKGNSYVKSKLILTFSIKNKFPKLKGKLTLANRKEVECEVIGNAPFEKPIKKSVDRETIKKQLSKVDNYPFQIIQININYDGTLFIPISKINELRRNLFEKLEHEVISLYTHKYKKIKIKHEKANLEETKPSISFYTNNLNHLRNIQNVKRVYLEIPPKDDDLDISSQPQHNLNHMINFIKEAQDISYDKDYELIWKWPDIAHDKLIKVLNKVRGILNKMNYNLPIMSNCFNGEYGPYSMNISNTATINSLDNYKILTISPELRKRDYEEIMKYCKNPEKIEILVQGSVELMKTRYSLLSKKELKTDYKNSLIDLNNNKHPIHKSISGEELIIFSDCELSLLSEISHLKEIGFSNFSIDGRYKDDDYSKMADIYNLALNNELNEKELLKISPKNMRGNY
ncbi:MAG: U32 family peptidase [Methanobrevibacter sp.]|uniref:U32 family peptidase n=1 Tax=Methanobrevibacter sp. TaxID=66852 RepID=UPI0025F06253|nr:U32 family peptidase [Methanobrevibacter sp.]MBR3112816.1 U32 family peptidase [Methanobrevibacter sp.]MBR6992691.1 U32 family peptidase [Methanobrevibacter sp.]